MLPFGDEGSTGVLSDNEYRIEEEEAKEHGEHERLREAEGDDVPSSSSSALLLLSDKTESVALVELQRLTMGALRVEDLEIPIWLGDFLLSLYSPLCARQSQLSTNALGITNRGAVRPESGGTKDSWAIDQHTRWGEDICDSQCNTSSSDDRTHTPAEMRARAEEVEENRRREQSLLKIDSPVVSMARKAGYLSLTARYISKATKDCGRLWKSVQAELRKREALASRKTSQIDSDRPINLLGNSGEGIHDHDTNIKPSQIDSGKMGGLHNDMPTESPPAVPRQQEPQALKKGVMVSSAAYVPYTYHNRYSYLLTLLEEDGLPRLVALREWCLHFASQLTQLEQSQTLQKSGVNKGRTQSKKRKNKTQSALLPAEWTGMASVGKQVAVVLHRFDQLLWRLRSVMAELDKPRRSRGLGIESVSHSSQTSAASNLTLSDDLRKPLLIVDGTGRKLLRDLLEQEERDGRRFEGSDEDEEIFVPEENRGKRKREC